MIQNTIPYRILPLFRTISRTEKFSPDGFPTLDGKSQPWRSRGSETLYLVDSFSLIFQVFHALPEMTSPAGLPTNALFGFTKDMMFLRNQQKPTYLVCCFDAPGPTFRDAIS